MLGGRSLWKKASTGERKTMLSRVAPIFPVRSMTKALRYFEEVLGFQRTHTSGDPITFAIVRRDDCELHLAKSLDGTPVHCRVVVRNIDVLFEEFAGKGARIVQGLRTQPWGLRDFKISDEDGNTLEMGESVRT